MEKQLSLVLGISKPPIKMSPDKIKRIIKKHIKNKRSCFVKLKNENSRLIYHSALDEPQFFWFWPISILQWIFVCTLNICEFSQKQEKVFDKQFLFRDFDKAIDIFLDSLTVDCSIILQ